MKALTKVIDYAWYHGAWWYYLLLIVLWPLSQVFCSLAAIRRKSLIGKQEKLSVPVIIVGNISVGGTGKTPLLAALASAITNKGKRVGIISRGYGGLYDGYPHSVKVADKAAEVGDEPLLLARITGCPVVVAHNRYDAARFLVERDQVDIILSDDGLQHYALPRTVEIAVLDAVRGLGNGLCLPAGPLREPVSRLQEVDFVVVNGSHPAVFHDEQLVVNLMPECWLSLHSGEALPLSALQPGTAVHAVAGIGNPQRFFATLRALGLSIIEHEFPDHYQFSAADQIFHDDLPVVMTEKDAVKCAGYAGDNRYALRVQMKLPDLWLEQLLARVDKNFRREK